MTADDNSKLPSSGSQKSSDSEKARLERQSVALRENLRRRNAQRRGRESTKRDSGSDLEKG